MKQEDKELLLKDLCARLPYRVMGERTWIAPVTGSPEKMKTVFGNFDIEVFTTGYSDCGELGFREVKDYLFKPYLFPLSSMTEGQKEEYNQSRLKDLRILNSVLTERISDGNNFDSLVVAYNEIDWLNKNHFDYRGLIEKALAIDATNLNIY